MKQLSELIYAWKERERKLQWERAEVNALEDDFIKKREYCPPSLWDRKKALWKAEEQLLQDWGPVGEKEDALHRAFNQEGVDPFEALFIMGAAGLR